MTQKNMKKKSLCEKSMQMMMNILKVSSFSLASMNLGDKHNPNSPLKLIPIETFSSFSSNSEKRSSQAKSNVQTYLVEHDVGDHHHHSRSSIHGRTTYGGDDVDDGMFSDYIKRFHKRNQNEMNKANTNGKASAYIRRFHEKNGRDYSLATSTAKIPLVLPPPPPLLIKK